MALYNYSAGTGIRKTDVLLTIELDCDPKPADATQTICSGESFSWNGTDYTTKLVQESKWMPADQVLNLTVTPKPVMLLLHKQSVRKLSLGMVLIIQLIKLVQESKQNC
jgi:hypothetical protein